MAEIIARRPEQFNLLTNPDPESPQPTSSRDHHIRAVDHSTVATSRVCGGLNLCRVKAVLPATTERPRRARNPLPRSLPAIFQGLSRSWSRSPRAFARARRKPGICTP